MRSVLCLLPFVSLVAAAQPGAPRPKTTDAVVIRRVDPEYTKEARAAKLEGIVTVYLEVDQEGNPGNMQVIQRLGLGLDEKAVDAVKQWRFRPATLNGDPVRAAQAVEIRFQLGLGSSWRVRHTAYSVVRGAKQKSADAVKPVLIGYTPPAAAACPAADGFAAVQMQVGKDGVPTDIRVSPSPDDEMGRAVSEAVSSWRFRPALIAKKARLANAYFVLDCLPPAAAGSNAAPMRVGRGVSAPSLISKVEPEYSEKARKAKYQGSVVMVLEVDPAGIPVNFRIPRMLGEGLDVKAMEAVKQWRFKPGMRDGKPVTVMATVEVNFRLL